MDEPVKQLQDQQKPATTVQPSRPHSFLIIIATLLSLLIGFGGGYAVFHKESQQAKQTTNSTLSPTQVAMQNSAQWSEYSDKYFRISFPGAMNLSNEEKAEYELENIVIGESGKALADPRPDYHIHILSINTGKDAMTVAKEDIAAHWSDAESATFAKHPLEGMDAVIVRNIVSGKGSWGPAVYIVKKNLAAQIVLENEIDITKDPYFDKIIKSFSFEIYQ